MCVCFPPRMPAPSTSPFTRAVGAPGYLFRSFLFRVDLIFSPPLITWPEATLLLAGVCQKSSRHGKPLMSCDCPSSLWPRQRGSDKKGLNCTHTHKRARALVQNQCILLHLISVPCRMSSAMVWMAMTAHGAKSPVSYGLVRFLFISLFWFRYTLAPSFLGRCL